MLHDLQSLHYFRIFLVSVIGFTLGGLWYSPLLFVKTWLKEMKITPAMMRASAEAGEGKLLMPAAFLLTVLSTVTLATLIAGHNPPGVLGGIEYGLFVGVGLVAARSGVNGLFEKRTMRHYMITTGHDVALCVLQGAILSVWR